MTSLGGEEQSIGTVLVGQGAIGALEVFVTCLRVWVAKHALGWAAERDLFEC